VSEKSSQIENSNRSTGRTRLHLLAAVLTLSGLALFSYFVYTVGIRTILEGVTKIGFDGFTLILFLYFCRIVIRALAWKLSVGAPYELSLRDTVPAVMIGESLSSMIPLGILVSGTSKAVAVRNRVPLVVGLSSVATENLFYSFVTGLFVSIGAISFLRSFNLEEGWVITIDILLAAICLLIGLGFLVVIKQWHWISGIFDWLYRRGILPTILEPGRHHIRAFENFIFRFYRKYPNRFIPILLMQILFHLLGIAEVIFILFRLSAENANIFNAFLLESVSRVVTVVFKLVPFLIGVDEAGAQFVTETLALGASLGVTLAIIRKGRILFWTAAGMLIILWRGFSFKDVEEAGRRMQQG